eukprot:330809-Pleurochrysis_carterae.AAC.1
MFEVELEDLVESGELTLGDMGALEEICEALHVSEERAEEMLQEAVTRRCNTGALQAVALLRQGAEAAMMDELKKVLKFAAIAPYTVEMPAVSMEEKQEVYMLFQARAGDAALASLSRLDFLCFVALSQYFPHSLPLSLPLSLFLPFA